MSSYEQFMSGIQRPRGLTSSELVEYAMHVPKAKLFIVLLDDFHIVKFIRKIDSVVLEAPSEDDDHAVVATECGPQTVSLVALCEQADRFTVFKTEAARDDYTSDLLDMYEVRMLEGKL